MEKGGTGNLKVFFLLFLLLFGLAYITSAFALEFSLASSYSFGSNLFFLYNEREIINKSSSWTFDVGIFHLFDVFEFKASMLAKNDSVFNDPFSESYYAGFYFDFKEGSISFRNNNFSVTLGRTHLGDVVLSPYSLFISSVNMPRNTIEISYDDGKFIYITRWTQLCELKFGADERERLKSSNYKVYALRVGNLRFGYEDITVYVGQRFNFEYFANPIPSFFIQYVNDAGRPYPEGVGETNYISGFFLDYTDIDRYYYTQVLVDDINMNRFIHPESYQNPDKIAWSIGLVQKTSIGTVSFYHAGATKYTFQPSAESGNQMFYGYTYYPYFVYTRDGENVVLPFELLYAGYKYGENNLAFMIDYAPSFATGVNADFEFVILGERSPVNAWNDRTTYLPGTHLLDDPVKEYRAIGTISYSGGISRNLKFWASVSAGFIWNASTLVEVSSDNVRKPLLRPQEGNNLPFFLGNFGVSFSKSF